MNLPTLFYYFAPVIGFVTLLIGIAAVLKPGPMSKYFGIVANEVALPYVVSTGIRDVFMGLTILILFYRQDWMALGAIHLCVGVVAISDFWVVQKQGDRKTSFVHLSGAVAVVAYGAILLWTH